MLDPWINVAGILLDCEQDSDPDTVEEQIRHVHRSKDQLQQHFRKYYLPSRPVDTPMTPGPALAPGNLSMPTSSPPVRRHFQGKARYRKGPLVAKTAPDGPDDELTVYLQLGPPSEDCPFSDPLKWWQSKAKTFPHLSRLARDIFSTLR